MNYFLKFSSRFLQLMLILSLCVFTNACSGNSSGNGGGTGTDPGTVSPLGDCPTNEPRCAARDDI